MKFDSLGAEIARKVYNLTGGNIQARMAAIITTTLESSDELRSRPFRVSENQIEHLQNELKKVEERWTKKLDSMGISLKETEKAGEDIRKKNEDLVYENRELKEKVKDWERIAKDNDASYCIARDALELTRKELKAANEQVQDLLGKMQSQRIAEKTHYEKVFKEEKDEAVRKFWKFYYLLKKYLIDEGGAEKLGIKDEVERALKGES